MTLFCLFEPPDISLTNRLTASPSSLAENSRIFFDTALNMRLVICLKIRLHEKAISRQKKTLKNSKPLKRLFAVTNGDQVISFKVTSF